MFPLPVLKDAHDQVVRIYEDTKSYYSLVLRSCGKVVKHSPQNTFYLYLIIYFPVLNKLFLGFFTLCFNS